MRLVRLAQDFTLRYPLVEGQGNFGSIMGLRAAASRYTEARLTRLSENLMNELRYDTVDMRLTYDAADQEPVILPARFPALLVNGSSGIAVGMATSMPPHNLVEVMKAAVHLVENPDASVAQLMRFVKGPDFPLGDGSSRIGPSCGRCMKRVAVRFGCVVSGSLMRRAVAELRIGLLFIRFRMVLPRVL